MRRGEELGSSERSTGFPIRLPLGSGKAIEPSIIQNQATPPGSGKKCNRYCDKKAA